jgi:DNA segregation ATPase FtsK/SpoIIIE-like protein
MFTSINAEIRRRQFLNADTGTKDIVEYRRRGLHLTRESYPHLFIIIDEYAEMIDDNPEYRSELESITRVGRAQGVHLLLASQRPKGVTDQMRANIKLRLCLRVEQSETSRELLQRPDAALLPSGLPGRGYLQVGNENLELIQVSYTGMTQPDDRQAAVEWPEREAVVDDPLETAGDQELPKLFDAIVGLSAELVGDERVPKPWPPFLPTQMSLQTPFWDTQAEQWRTLSTTVTDWLNGETAELWTGIDWRQQALQPALGLVDDPVEARQYPLRLGLHRGHLAVFGDSGWGKTSFLRSLMISLASEHSPDELHLHVLDLGGRSFRSLEKLPHVGAMIYADEESFEERLQRLLAKLNQMVDARMQLLSSEGAANLFEFNERFKDRALPAVVVLIDSFAPLQEDYELLVDATLVPLVRRSLAAGLVFAVTANDPSSMPRKLRALLSEQLTFRQSNPDRYLDIVGRGAIDFDEIQGRGYLRSSRRPLLFQAALPVGALSGLESPELLPESEELQRFARNMAAEAASTARSWGTEPDPVPILPETTSLRDVLEMVESPRKNRIEAVLGLGGDLLPVALDLRRMPSHFAIVGPPLSGKTSTLYAWLFSLSYRYSPDHAAFVLVDFQRRFADYGGTQSLEELPHVAAVIREIEELEALLPALRAEAETLAGREPVREIFCLIDNFDDAGEEIETNRSLARELALLARRHGRDGLHFVIAGPMAGTPTELRRRVTSAGLGVGLQSESALDALRVSRRPARLGVRELPVGRGYLVRSGQPSLIQIANPYTGLGNSVSPAADVEDEEYLAQALDAWVALINARFPGEKATLGSEPVPVRAGGAAAPERSPAERSAARELLQRALKWEADRLTQVADGIPVVTAALARIDAGRWEEEQELEQILRAVWREEKKSQGLPEDTLQSLLKSLDDRSLVMEVKQFLPELDGEKQRT